MATIKSYTDIEQSKKLAEILPNESADMQYISFRHKDDTIKWIPQLGIPSRYDIPCWSLAALLGILPEPNLLEKDGWHLFYSDTDHFSSSSGYNNPVDACYEMIIHLHELKML